MHNTAILTDSCTLLIKIRPKPHALFFFLLWRKNRADTVYKCTVHLASSPSIASANSYIFSLLLTISGQQQVIQGGKNDNDKLSELEITLSFIKKDSCDIAYYKEIREKDMMANFTV